jgi:hypothetical protein
MQKDELMQENFLMNEKNLIVLIKKCIYAKYAKSTK